jgi:hypothetical protein
MFQWAFEVCFDLGLPPQAVFGSAKCVDIVRFQMEEQRVLREMDVYEQGLIKYLMKLNMRIVDGHVMGLALRGRYWKRKGSALRFYSRDEWIEVHSLADRDTILFLHSKLGICEADKIKK